MRSFDQTRLQAATVITAAETIMGGAIDVRNFDTMVVWLTYTKGDETSVKVIPKYLHTVAGTEYPHMEWSVANDKLVVVKTFLMSASASTYIILDVEAFAQIKLYNDPTGGTPSGKLAVDYTLLRKV